MGILEGLQRMPQEMRNTFDVRGGREERRTSCRHLRGIFVEKLEHFLGLLLLVDFRVEIVGMRLADDEAVDFRE